MDDKDRKILNTIKSDAKLTTQQIAKKTLMPITTIHNRIKKMQKQGIIKGYSTDVDYKKIGLGITAYILIAVDFKNLEPEDIGKRFREAVSPHGVIETINTVTGLTDIVLKVKAADMDSLDNFISNNIRKLDFVRKTQTHLVLRNI